jgi:GABA(A) receptor-associated protein
MILTDFDKKLTESNRIREKYPERVPVIVGKARGSTLNDIDKKKYLIPNDVTMGQFISIIRTRINISPDKAIFVFINNILPPTSSRMITLYEEMKNKDGFLYVYYNCESVFGNTQYVQAFKLLIKN